MHAGSKEVWKVHDLLMIVTWEPFLPYDNIDIDAKQWSDRIYLVCDPDGRRVPCEYYIIYCNFSSWPHNGQTSASKFHQVHFAQTELLHTVRATIRSQRSRERATSHISVYNGHMFPSAQHVARALTAQHWGKHHTDPTEIPTESSTWTQHLKQQSLKY